MAFKNTGFGIKNRTKVAILSVNNVLIDGFHFSQINIVLKIQIVLHV